MIDLFAPIIMIQGMRSSLGQPLGMPVCPFCIMGVVNKYGDNLPVPQGLWRDGSGGSVKIKVRNGAVEQHLKVVKILSRLLTICSVLLVASFVIDGIGREHQRIL